MGVRLSHGNSPPFFFFPMNYLPDPGRYSHAAYRRCGRSGLLLPPVSLGLWHNFGAADDFENARRLIHGAFDAGITYFDLANNY